MTRLNHHRAAMRRIVDGVWNTNERLLAHAGRHIVLDRWRMYYGFWLAVQLRRETDKDSRSISLANIVTDISRHSTVLTEEQVRRLWRDPHGVYASSTFRDFADPTGNHFEPDIAVRHAEELAAASEVLRTFVNKALVHRERDFESPAPTFNEMDAIADKYEDIAKDYILLLTGAAFRFKVIDQIDSLDVFDFAWRVNPNATITLF